MMHHRKVNDSNFVTYWQGIEIARIVKLESVWQIRGSRLCGQNYKTDLQAMSELNREYGESV